MQIRLVLHFSQDYLQNNRAATSLQEPFTHYVILTREDKSSGVKAPSTTTPAQAQKGYGSKRKENEEDAALDKAREVAQGDDDKTEAFVNYDTMTVPDRHHRKILAHIDTTKKHETTQKTYNYRKNNFIVNGEGDDLVKISKDTTDTDAEEDNTTDDGSLRGLLHSGSNGGQGSFKCATLARCLGYAGCLFTFGNEFCLFDPLPGQRKVSRIRSSRGDRIIINYHLWYNCIFRTGAVNFIPYCVIKTRGVNIT